MEFAFAWAFKYVELAETAPIPERLSAMNACLRAGLEIGDRMQQLLDYRNNIVAWNKRHDNYWGSCTCENWPCGNGANWIGRILGQIKYEIEDAAKASKVSSGD